MGVEWKVPSDTVKYSIIYILLRGNASTKIYNSNHKHSVAAQVELEGNRKIFLLFTVVVAVDRSESETNRNDTPHTVIVNIAYTCDGRKSARTVLQYA